MSHLQLLGYDVMRSILLQSGNDYSWSVENDSRMFRGKFQFMGGHDSTEACKIIAKMLMTEAGYRLRRARLCVYHMNFSDEALTEKFILKPCKCCYGVERRFEDMSLNHLITDKFLRKHYSRLTFLDMYDRMSVKQIIESSLDLTKLRY